jgi:hypothetical protein
MAHDEEWKVRMDHEMADVVRAMAGRRGLSLNRYVLQALTHQLQVDVANWPTGHLRQMVEQGTEKTTVAANFAAIHAQAVLILLKEWRTDTLQRTEGLPEDLARQRVQLDVEDALAESLQAFEDPRIRRQYAWVERPARDQDLPPWLTDSDESEEYDDLTADGDDE